MKRFLRDLHRGHEREEREKDRAKQEVERLNGVVSGDPTKSFSSTNNTSGPPWRRREAAQQLPPAQRQVTTEERMKQMAQLADMGVSIPQEFRGDMAMAGEWQTVSERVILPENSEVRDTKENIRTSGGDKKRKYLGSGDDEEEEEENHNEPVRRKAWGSTTKTYPGLRAEDDDLEALLRDSKPILQTNTMARQPVSGVRSGDSTTNANSTSALPPPNNNEVIPTLKTEPSEGLNRDPLKVPDVTDVKEIGIKQDPDTISGEVLFKKRKAKNIRQK